MVWVDDAVIIVLPHRKQKICCWLELSNHSDQAIFRTPYRFSSVTIFTKIIQKEIPADIVHEDDLCLAFHDVSPQAPVHVLLIPKKPLVSLDSFAEEDRELAGHLLTMVPKIASTLGLTKGYRTVINSGEDGGQSVFHLHIHILGGRSLSWPPG